MSVLKNMLLALLKFLCKLYVSLDLHENK